MLLQFGKDVCVESAVHAEVMTLREGLLVVAVGIITLLHVRIRLKSVMAWVANSLSIPWLLHTILRECCHVFRAATS